MRASLVWDDAGPLTPGMHKALKLGDVGSLDRLPGGCSVSAPLGLGQTQVIGGRVERPSPYQRLSWEDWCLGAGVSPTFRCHPRLTWLPWRCSAEAEGARGPGGKLELLPSLSWLSPQPQAVLEPCSSHSPLISYHHSPVQIMARCRRWTGQARKQVHHTPPPTHLSCPSLGPWWDRHAVRRA